MFKLGTKYIFCMAIFAGILCLFWYSKTSFYVQTKEAMFEAKEASMPTSNEKVSAKKDLYMPLKNTTTDDKKRKDESLKELIKILHHRLEQENDAAKIEYNSSCGPILKACIDPTCKHPLNSSPEERLKDLVTSPSLTLSDLQRDLILSIAREVNESDVIIATSSSSNHYPELQAMFKNLHEFMLPRIEPASVVFFDLGLTTEQRLATEKSCRCQVVSFPFKLFPPHVRDLSCFGWKPIIVLALMSRARKLLAYQDTSVRWVKDPQFILSRAEKYGSQYIRFVGADSVAINTIKQTFDYMNEDPCSYLPYPELQGGVTFHKKDQLVIRAILEPWARCALEAKCVCPATPSSVISCMSKSRINRCHRFDQSVLGILTAKLYAKDMYRVVAPEPDFDKPIYLGVKRGDQLTNYFKI